MQKRANKSFFRSFIAAALLFAVAAVFTGCGKSSKRKIVGKWAFGTYIVYTFNENGEVTATVADSPGKIEKYSLPDNETLIIESPDKGKATLKISFTDNDNTLNMTNESGTKHTLKRQQ